jgi:glutamate carboxypeptidase
MKCKKLFETIDSLYDEYLDVWEAICNIESPTRCKEGVDASAKLLIDMAVARGWKVETVPCEKAGDAVCITLNPDAPDSPISISGHLDTVHPIGSFGTPAVRRDGEKIYGPGVNDCKGGVVAGFLAMDALDRVGFRTRPVQLLLQTDEEVGSGLSGKKTINYMIEKSKNAVAFLNLEGHTPGEACLIRKGIVTFTFTVTGIEAHSANCAEAGANAIADAAYKIIELEKIKDADGLTCNCAVISGGTVSNTVPGRCEFKANVRFATQEQLAWMRDYVQKLADTVHVPGCKCTVNQPKGRAAMEYCERNAALLEKMNRIYAENDMPELKVGRRKGGSDAADVTEAGIPCLDNFGTFGGGIHTPNEYGLISSLPIAAKRLCAIIAHL